MGHDSQRQDCSQGCAHNVLPPNVISNNSAISACEPGGHWQHALGMLLRMQHNDVLPDVVNYSSAISACARGGQWQHALGLLVEMRHNDSLPDVVSCRSDITASAKRVGNGSMRSDCLQRCDTMIRCQMC